MKYNVIEFPIEKQELSFSGSVQVVEVRIVEKAKVVAAFEYKSHACQYIKAHKNKCLEVESV